MDRYAREAVDAVNPILAEDGPPMTPPQAFAGPGRSLTYPHGLDNTPGQIAATKVSGVPVFMSADPAVRKLMPVATGVYAYFPDALLCVSWISRVGNEQHNPGEPLHWAKHKSTDQEDACARHQLDTLRGTDPDPALAELGRLAHMAQRAWRALAALQMACDSERAKVGGAK